MLILSFRCPLAAGSEEPDLLPYFYVAAPWSSQACITMGDEVCLEVTSFRVEIKNRVSASNRLLIARLLLTDLLGIERPCIICACWNKKQLDVVVSKLQFLPHEIWSIQRSEERRVGKECRSRRWRD